jgi:hypothetical protein
LSAAAANDEVWMMARKVVSKRSWLPIGPRNRLWFGVAVVVIVIGYVFLSIGPWDSLWSLTIAPIFLGAGYFVLLPYAIMTRDRPAPNQSKE